MPQEPSFLEHYFSIALALETCGVAHGTIGQYMTKKIRTSSDRIDL